MRPEGNPLDLNNLPDEYSRDGKQVLQDSSSTGCRKKKSGGRDGKDECGKVYECRFCSLKFCKSQALGGHMNRHRQERETETLNHARQLVFRNDHNLAPQSASHLGCCQPVAPGGYHPAGNMGDPTMALRFPRYLSGSSSTHITPPPPPQPSQPYLYASPSRPVSFPSPYSQHPVNDYLVGHVLRSSQQYGGHHSLNYVAAGAAAAATDSGYTCIGAPVGQAFAGGGGGAGGHGRGSEGGGKDGSLQNQEEGLNWGRSYSGAQQRLDPHSAINRFQDGF